MLLKVDLKGSSALGSYVKSFMFKDTVHAQAKADKRLPHDTTTIAHTLNKSAFTI